MKIAEWVDAQTPAVPESFRPRLDADGPASAEGFAAAAAAGLKAALECGPADRRGAHVLLAADAYVTWACALALSEEDVPAALAGVADALRQWEERDGAEDGERGFAHSVAAPERP